MRKKVLSKIRLFSAILVLILIQNACRYNEPPLLITAGMADITHNSATGGGTVMDDGGREVIVRGLVWGTAPDPDLDVYTGMTEAGAGPGIFTGLLTGLTPGTSYYVRAYATNSVGTSYGDVVEFTTAPATPDVVTAGISGIGPRQASAGVSVRNDRGNAVTDRGLVWNRSGNPSLENNEGITREGEGTGTFESEIRGLQHSTGYSLRAYATNSAGTGYGIQMDFTTASPSEPSLSTSEVTSVRARSAVSGGNVSSDGGAPVTARGLVAGSGMSPRLESNDGITREGSGTGSFSSMIRDLEPGTPYFIRAWATNIAGTAYGEQVSFTTPEPVPPAMSYPVVSDIDVSVASGRVSVENDGNADISLRGFVWSRLESPETGNNEGMFTAGEGTGGFTGRMEGLRPGTRYYIRGFATNEAGTSYSAQVQFTTLVNLPVVTTLNVRGYTTGAAIFGNRLTDDGGDNETYRGMVIGTSENPDLENNGGITNNGYGTGDFLSEFTQLRPGTTYYARAWAANSAGIAYGRQARFTTINECGEEVVFDYQDETVTYGTVVGIGGACWMDRNLGASRVASSFRDSEAFGDLYQWGRLKDGHENRAADSISRLSSSNQPGHGSFIVAINSPYDWRSPQNDNLWKAEGGPNGVCPAGWRLPTWKEWDDEAGSWEKQNRRGAIDSPLKLPAAGLRSNNSRFFDNGRRGYYWTSTVDSIYSALMIINRHSAMVNTSTRASSRSVRCIREEVGAGVVWLP